MDLEFSQPCEQEANHGQIDHGFAGLGLAFVIATEPAGAAQPAEGARHDPAAWQHFERMKFGAFDDLEGAAPQLLTPDRKSVV